MLSKIFGCNKSRHSRITQQQIIAHNKRMLTEESIKNALFPPYRTRSNRVVSDDDGNLLFNLVLIINKQNGRIEDLATRYIDVPSNQTHLPITVVLNRQSFSLIKIDFPLQSTLPDSLKPIYSLIRNLNSNR